MSARELITENLGLWTGAVTQKSTRGRGSNSKIELTGIKKLRELILELAVRGKLVEQDSADESASMLLEQITVEKTQLAKEGRIKKPKKLPDLEEQEKPFDLPNGWQWARMEAVSEYIQRGKGPKYAESGKVRAISQKCVQWSGFDLKAARFVDDNSLDGYQDERYIRENDILWNSTGTGTVGRAIVVEKQECSIVADSHVTIIRPLVSEPRHILNYILSPSVQQRIEPDHGNSLVSGTTKQVELNSTSVKMLAVPLPPLNEQHRIVQKVDELMALCDRLEQQTSDQLEAHETLVDTLLGTLTQSENATELADNWARLAAHFDTLFTTEQSIDKLKQTILQLAVMGRLVEQDSGDEPADILLTQIHTRKTELAGEKRIKWPRPLPQLDDTQHNYTAPAHWAWASFQDVADEISTGPFGSMIHKHDYVEAGIPLINPSHMVKGQIKEDSSVSVTPTKAEELSSYKLATGDIVMARRGEVGRCAVVTNREDEWLCGTGSFVLRFHPAINRQFILMLFSTETVRDYLTGNSVGTTMTNLNHGILKKMPVALPSSEEQHRIVQKVDELMTLCDQLKERLIHASETRCQLAEMVVKPSVH